MAVYGASFGGVLTGLICIIGGIYLSPDLAAKIFSPDSQLANETVTLISVGRQLLFWGGSLLFLLSLHLILFAKDILHTGTEFFSKEARSTAGKIIIISAIFSVLIGVINVIQHVQYQTKATSWEKNFLAELYVRLQLIFSTDLSFFPLQVWVALGVISLLTIISVRYLRTKKVDFHLFTSPDAATPKPTLNLMVLLILFVAGLVSLSVFSVTARGYLVLTLMLSPWAYLVWRIRDRNYYDLFIYLGIVALYAIINVGLISGDQFAYHDTRQGYHIPFLIFYDWIRHGYAIGWNSFLNGGEPLYLYSNFYLWAELAVLSLVNQLFNLPPNNLINIFFTYIFITYFTIGLIFFSIVFRSRATSFFPTIVLAFGGMTLVNLGQFQLAGVYFVPLVALAIYMFYSRKQWLFLGWAIFFFCVSVNHYLPGYILYFFAAFLLSFAAVKFFLYKKYAVRKSKIPYSTLWTCVIVVLSLSALATFLYLFAELRDEYVSPVRGYAGLTETHIGPQPSVNIDFAKYAHLFYVSGKDISNLSYAHSIHYVGLFIVLLAILSLQRSRSILYLSWVITFVLLVIIGLGETTPLWSALKKYAMVFNLRHSFFFGTTIAFAVIFVAAFGFRNYMTSTTLQKVSIFLIIITGVAFSIINTKVTSVPPEPIEKYVYPSYRNFLSSKSYTNLPLDFTPIFTREAVVTHPEGNFIFFQRKKYINELENNTPYLMGPLFFFLDPVRDKDVIAGKIRDQKALVGEERIELLAEPATLIQGQRYFQKIISGLGGRAPIVGIAREDEDPGGGGESVMVMPPRESRFEFIFNDVSRLRGKDMQFSVAVKSKNQVWDAIGIAIFSKKEKEKEDKSDITDWRLIGFDNYHNSGKWVQLTAIVTVPKLAAQIKLRIYVTIGADSTVYFKDPIVKLFDPALGRITAAGSAIKILPTDDPNRVVVEVDAPTDTWLVRRENWHSGWKAKVDGQATPIKEVLGTFQGVLLPKGKHVVEYSFFSYYPWLMWLHVVATLLGYLLFFWFLLRYGDLKHDPEAEGSPNG